MAWAFSSDPSSVAGGSNPFASISIATSTGSAAGPDAGGVRPSSPWAARFGRFEAKDPIFSAGDFDHSGFAPEYPRVDPIYYGNNPDSEQRFSGFGRGYDEDRLFSSEKLQRFHLQGLRSWQTGPLNSFVSFSQMFNRVPGGHAANEKITIPQRDRADPFSLTNTIQRLTGMEYNTRDEVLFALYESQRIKVNEDEWLRFFRKDRWWNLAGSHPNPGLQWSVDDPRVWTELSICLELANRILMALINDQHDWLRTIIFGRLDYWRNVRHDPPSPDTRVLLSAAVDRAVCQVGRRRCFHDVTQLPEWGSRLEGLLVNLRFTFMDNPESTTVAVHDPYRGGIISLDINLLKRLWGAKVTVAEKCQIAVMVAKTLLHELMHAINFVRMTCDPPQANNFLSVTRDPKLSLEPFVDFDAAAEIGHAFEKAVFGGSSQAYPPLGIPISLWTITWPWAQSSPFPQNKRHPMFAQGSTIRTWRIPASWASKLLSASFWNDATLPRKSDNSFHMTPIFTSTTTNAFPAPKQWGEVTVNRAAAALANNVDQEIVRGWDNRHNLWNSFRGEWYRKAQEKWESTPWNHPAERELLGVFARCFKEHDEVGCALAANNSVIRIGWFGNRTKFVESLPPHDDTNWIFSTIGITILPPLVYCLGRLSKGFAAGLLMMAACPIRTSRISGDTSIEVKMKDRRIYASQQALAAGVSPEPVALSWGYPPTSCNPARVGNPLRNIDTYGPRVTQFDYLDMVSDVINHLASNQILVSGPWLCEILRASKMLREDRTNLRQQYPHNHTSKWASAWPFRLAEYNSSSVVSDPPLYELWVRWDPAQKDWVAGAKR
ncbi:hypothetical protein HD806DRAFT_539231 [Xylariaceae sp. AK1471]|nr:hypothetical protein HD806DRAFT_539231 [Xylariaceae sp. AK1471]